MSDASKAVFLSYASQDAEAAKRIADALRSSGVEVWFDAEGGLEHGDAWDAKIRRQIKECVLFIPIVSAHTEEREEGYFRLEWDLAAERARNIASGVAFILPVVIDGTRETDAMVPDRFRSVQWTKLPGGNVPPEVLQRFLKLWSHRTGALKHRSGKQEAESKKPEHVGGVLHPDRLAESGYKIPPTKTKGRGLWIAAAVLVVLIAGALGQRYLQRERPASSSNSVTAPAGPRTEAQELVAKAWAEMNKPGLARAELEIAGAYCKQAAELDPNDADVWAAWSQVDSWSVYHNFDTSPARREAARTKAARAMQLSPNSFEARLARACQLVRGEGPSTTVSMFAPEAERLLRTLLQEKPDEPRTLFALGILLRNTGEFPECREIFGRMAKHSAFTAEAWSELAWAEYIAGDHEAAWIGITRSIALQAYWGNLTLKVILAQWWLGDLDLAQATLDQIPAASRQEDIGVHQSTLLAHWRREPAVMLRILNGVARDWLQSNAFAGPKAWYAGLAHQMAGHHAAAQVQWRTALTIVERRLADQPDSGFLLHWKGTLLAALGDRAAAEPVLQLAREVDGGKFSLSGDVTDQVFLGHWDVAITRLEQAANAGQRFATAASFRLNPLWEPLRTQPRFQALLARMENDPRFSPTVKVPSASSPISQRPSPSSLHTADTKSVAVLPFVNLSGDPTQEYFSDGLTEEILNAIARERDLRVPGRSSSFSFKGRNVAAAEIAKALNVGRLVEGSVRKSGNRVRISVSLTRAADVFSEEIGTFTEEVSDIFALQDKVARIVVEKLTSRTNTAAVAVLTKNPAAYDAYLRGRAAQMADGLGISGDEHYAEAVRLDPDFALAWARLALTLDRGLTIRRQRSAETTERIQAAARRAAQLAPNLSEAHMALGAISDDPATKLRELAIAEELRPNDAEVLAARAQVYLWSGKWDDEACRLALRAAELDPRSSATLCAMGFMLSNLGRHADAARLLAQAQVAAPLDHTAYRFQATNILRWKGDVRWGLKKLDECPEAGRGQTYYLARANLHGLARDFPAAIADCERVRQQAAANGDKRFAAHSAYNAGWWSAQAGQASRGEELYAEAAALAQPLLENDAGMLHMLMARIHATAGRRAEALASLGAAQRGAGNSVSQQTNTLIQAAEVRGMLSDVDEAVAALRSVLDRGWGGLGYTLRVDPSWRPLRDHPKFQQLMKDAEARADAGPRSSP